MRRTLSLSILLALAATATPARAQQELMCAPREDVVRQLSVMFSERPVNRGLTGDGMLLEMFASAEGTWTAVLSEPSGVSCLVSGGEAWQTIDPSTRIGTVPDRNGDAAGREYRM